MKKTLQSFDDVVKLIEDGKVLSLAGDESILAKLPKGNWIAGTIPYFMTKDKGGVFSKDEIYVDDFSKFADDFKIVSYNKKNFKDISGNIYENGFTLFIIPAFSEMHEFFAVNYWQIKNLYKNPFVGWISGFDLSNTDAKPMTVNGLTYDCSMDDAIAVHVKLPINKKAGVSIVNIFNQDKQSDSIQFLKSGFSVDECIINDEKVNFVDYLIKNKIDTKLPIVADYSGISINVSIKEVDETKKIVHFYAPIFENRTYMFARQIDDYITEFDSKVSKHYNEKAFSCNCILNYLYGDLENKVIEIGGPITFGEIAFSLLNQTLVYMTINDKVE